MRMLMALAVAGAIGGWTGIGPPPDDYVPPNAPEFFVRTAIVGAVNDAFAREDFGRIDSLAKDYLDHQALTPAGTWKLGVLYDALNFQPPPTNGDEYPLQRAEDLTKIWIKKFPHSATARVIYAQQLVGHAFFFRGSAYASDVDPSAWPKFRDYIARSAVVLQSCPSFCKTDPEWYAAMLNVALYQDWNEKRTESLINEATTKFPYYQRIWFAASQRTLPNWGGSFEDLDRLVQDAVVKTSAKQGTIFYARIYGNAAHMMGEGFNGSRMVWPRMFNALSETLTRYPDPWNANEFAWFACMQGDHVWMAHLLPQIEKGPPLYAIWHDDRVLNLCKTWAKDKDAPPNVSPFALLPQKPARKNKGTTSL